MPQKETENSRVEYKGIRMQKDKESWHQGDFQVIRTWKFVGSSLKVSEHSYFLPFTADNRNFFCYPVLI